MATRGRAICCCVLLLLAGCTGAPRHGAARAASTSAAPSPTVGERVGAPGCRPPSPISLHKGLLEVHGTSSRLSMWGLLMTEGAGPLREHEDIKIVWRITGSGGLHLVDVDPAGHRHPVQWGPEPHSGSSYTRPGDEWGAGYRFGRPGCWTLRATRGTRSASVWLDVAA